MCRGSKPKLIWVLYILLPLISAPLKAQVIIDNEREIPADQIAFRENLLGLRPVSPGFFETAQLSPYDAGIPAAAFVASASATQAMKDAIIGIGKNPGDATVEDWYSASKTVGLLEVSAEQKPALVPATLWPGKKVQVDSVLLASLPDTELFMAKPSLYARSVEGYMVDFLTVNPRPFEVLAGSYKIVTEAETAPVSDASKLFTEATAELSQYSLMAKAATFLAGQVTFGQPIVYTAQEKKLVVPAAVSAQNNVYLVEFAVSFRDIAIANIETLAFSVLLPPGIVALELVPLRFDKEASVTRRGSSPEIKVQVGQNAVELGKVYEQEVVYTSIKPIIVADGLQENDFAWSLSDEAVQKGAHRFVAVIQVPKGRQSVTAQLQASAKTKRWFAQGDVVSTMPKLVELRLQ